MILRGLGEVRDRGLSVRWPYVVARGLMGARGVRGVRGLGEDPPPEDPPVDEPPPEEPAPEDPALPTCASLHLPPGFVGPVNCIGPWFPAPASQSQVAAAYMGIEELRAEMEAERRAKSNTGTYVAVGVAALALLVAMKR